MYGKISHNLLPVPVVSSESDAGWQCGWKNMLQHSVIHYPCFLIRGADAGMLYTSIEGLGRASLYCFVLLNLRPSKNGAVISQPCSSAIGRYFSLMRPKDSNVDSCCLSISNTQLLKDYCTAKSPSLENFLAEEKCTPCHLGGQYLPIPQAGLIFLSPFALFFLPLLNCCSGLKKNSDS